MSKGSILVELTCEALFEAVRTCEIEWRRGAPDGGANYKNHVQLLHM